MSQVSADPSFEIVSMRINEESRYTGRKTSGCVIYRPEKLWNPLLFILFPEQPFFRYSKGKSPAYCQAVHKKLLHSIITQKAPPQSTYIVTTQKGVRPGGWNPLNLVDLLDMGHRIVFKS